MQAAWPFDSKTKRIELLLRTIIFLNHVLWLNALRTNQSYQIETQRKQKRGTDKQLECEFVNWINRAILCSAFITHSFSFRVEVGQIIYPLPQELIWTKGTLSPLNYFSSTRFSSRLQ